MYHARFIGNPFDAGFKFGKQVLKQGKRLNQCPTFEINEERRKFFRECEVIYKVYYPEILEELKGIAKGNEVEYECLATMICTMYCFNFDVHCSCFAFYDEENIIFGRNSDFLVEIEKLYMNCIYQLEGNYRFIGNTTAYVEIEDGVNEYGLAIGLTAIFPKMVKPGFNSGILVRYLLEKCRTTKEALKEIERLPIASSMTLTLADTHHDLIVVEASCDEIKVIDGNITHYVLATNQFSSAEMKKYNMENYDNWQANTRYHTLLKALNENKEKDALLFAMDLLRGKYGFICEYNRKENKDTVWSSIYDLKNKKIYRVEGNPRRKKFKEDSRIKWFK